MCALWDEKPGQKQILQMMKIQQNRAVFSQADRFSNGI